MGRFYDVYTTYLYTPDLSRETNIIVKYFGAGWTSVIIFQSLIVAIVIYCLYYYFFKFKATMPSDPKLTIKEFTSHLHNGDISSFGKIFYKTPKNKDVLFASIGFIASMTLIVVSFIVGSSTLFLLFSDKYRGMYKQGIPTLLYCIIAGLGIYFTLTFYRTEYKKYKSATLDTQKGVEFFKQ